MIRRIGEWFGGLITGMAITMFAVVLCLAVVEAQGRWTPTRASSAPQPLVKTERVDFDNFWLIMAESPVLCVYMAERDVPGHAATVALVVKNRAEQPGGVCR